MTETETKPRKPTIHEPEATYRTVCWRFGRITYVPHYSGSPVYVGPGYPTTDAREYTPRELSRAGAVPCYAHLWRRPGDAFQQEVRA